jgi:hypothetical protein
VDDAVTFDAERQTVPLGETLAATAMEIDALAEIADRLQSLVGRLIGDAGAARDHRVLQEAQGLDALVQRLRALGSFVHALLPTLSSDLHVDARSAAREVPLSDLARALDRRAAELGDAGRSTPGTYEFFEDGADAS